MYLDTKYFAPPISGASLPLSDSGFYKHLVPPGLQRRT